MKLEIDFKKITDAPYKKDLSSFFNFTRIEVESLVDLISNMNESSYYLSGYRGVGKTSFIFKVEEELRKKNNFVFIHVPIPKFDKYEILIRNFIRRFHNQFIENNFYNTHEEIKNNPKTNNLVSSLEKLNLQTFSSINYENIVSYKIQKEKETILVEYKTEILFFIAVIVMIFVSNFSFKSETYKVIAQLMSLGWTIVQSVKLGNTSIFKKSTTKQQNKLEKSLYDDEIAEFKFISLLKDFKAAKIKLVFIIDELDKLPIEDAKKILYLFKSTMLSGEANFIVVGGQDLYYELYALNEAEDPILSTFFSKTLHVPLKSSSELRDLFKKLILNYEIIKSEEQIIAFDQFVNRLILESRKIPRKFINLIKNEVFFEEDKAFINVPEDYVRPSNTELLGILDRVSDQIPNKPQPIKDYIALNLYQHIENIINISNEEDLKEYINKIK